jgi:hypothetical protein
MKDSKKNEIDDSQESNLISLKQFLETIPPSVTYAVSDFTFPVHTEKNEKGRLVVINYISEPTIEIFCEECGSVSLFLCRNERQEFNLYVRSYIFVFVCVRCNSFGKTYAVKLSSNFLLHVNHEIVKIGEYPPFGSPTPSRLISLIGRDRELFIFGRRAENQGLGIGAFAYYRRIIENQKGRLIKKIAEVAKRLGAEKEILDLFDKAATETQFSRAIDDIKNVIPQSLLIRGHNPLLLLHSALSEGLHAKTDKECLELATNIRVVLTELAERISQALKDDTELKLALNNLLKTKTSN